MKKITMEIPKLVLPIVIGCFLGGGATNAFSKDTAISWGNKAPNSHEKYGVLRLEISQKKCIYKNNKKLKETSLDVQIVGVGTFFSSQLLFNKSNKPDEEKTKIGIRLIPYIIGETEKRRVLVPKDKKNVNKFYPGCGGKHQQIVSQFLPFYPIMLFKVDNEADRDLLKKRLENLKEKEETERRFDEVDEKAVNIGELLQKVFHKVFHSKQVKFLEGLPFNVCVELIDEANILNPQVKFNIMNNEMPPPCPEAPTMSTIKNEQPERDAPKVAGTGEPPECESDFSSNARAKLEKIVEENKAALQKYQQYSIPKDIMSKGELTHDIQKIFDLYLELLAAKQSKPPKCQSEKGATKVGQHKLIVVSLSGKFSSEQQKALQNSLIEILQEKSKSNSKFTLFTIQQGRKLYELLSSDQLSSLSNNQGEHSIQGQIEWGVQFGASDLRTLDDLGLVDFVIQKKANTKSAVGKVLYLTDNIRLNPDEKPPSKQRGVPLAWCEDGISLTVLTTKECGIWEKYMKAECESWKNKNQLKKAIEKFLQENN